jgi:pyrroloquinoline quinone biosynthesis protein E
VLGLNVVIYALNIDRLGSMVELCRRFSPERIELANAQYYGWALLNRASLLPTREQLARAERTYDELRERLAPALELIWVLPDYYQRRPKPCMGGWARTSVTITPDGTVLPCLAAQSIATLRFESVREQPLAWIWHDSDAFNAFRGTGWMPEPCRTCEWRERDHGGCRCQAYLLTGDARRTDPVCEFSADHRLVEAALEHASEPNATDDVNNSRTERRLIHRRFRSVPPPTQLTTGDPLDATHGGSSVASQT